MATIDQTPQELNVIMKQGDYWTKTARFQVALNPATPKVLTPKDLTGYAFHLDLIDDESTTAASATVTDVVGGIVKLEILDALSGTLRGGYLLEFWQTDNSGHRLTLAAGVLTVIP